MDADQVSYTEDSEAASALLAVVAFQPAAPALPESFACTLEKDDAPDYDAISLSLTGF